MELVRCSRCGAFYTNNGYVCPKCQAKDNSELSTFKNFVEKNGIQLQSISQVSVSTGISEKKFKPLFKL